MTTATVAPTQTPAGFVARLFQGIGIFVAALGIAIVISISFPVSLWVALIIILVLLVIRAIFGPSNWIKFFMALLSIYLVFYLVVETGGKQLTGWVKREFPVLASAMPRIQLGQDVAATAALEPGATEAKLQLLLYLRKQDEELAKKVKVALDANKVEDAQKLITEQISLRARIEADTIIPGSKSDLGYLEKTASANREKPWTRVLYSENVALGVKDRKETKMFFEPNVNIEIEVVRGNNVRRILGKGKEEYIAGVRRLTTGGTGVFLFESGETPAELKITKYNS